MKFCPVVPEICHGQVHGPRKERKRKRMRRRIIIIIIIIIIRNGAKTISLQTLFGRLNNNNNKKRSKNNKSPNVVWET
jgi:flagellar basal body-associated protein FliL